MSIGQLIIVLIISLVLIIRKVFIAHPHLAELYIRNIYPYITNIWRKLNSLLPFSFTEVFVYVLVILAIIFIVYLITKAIKKELSDKKTKAKLRNIFTVVLLVFSFMLSTFYINFAYAYNRNDLATNLGIDLEKISVEQLYEASTYLRDELNKASLKVSRNEEGEFQPEIKLEDVLKDAYLNYEEAAKNTENQFFKDYLYMGPVRVKPVLSSSLWSYTGTTGIFIPFWMESSVNIDTTADEIIFSALHEIAHSYGFARENEANFLAFYVGVNADDPDIRYSSLIMSYTYLNNALYGEDKSLHQKLYQGLRPEVRIDLSKRNHYWDLHEGEIKEASRKTNDKYLKSNQQDSGVKSYGEVVDLIVAYYFLKIK